MRRKKKPELEFTQEFIDRVLQERGTFSKYFYISTI